VADKQEAKRAGKARTPEEWWHGLLTGESRDVPLRESRLVLSVLSAHSRCKFCNAPFDGTWAPVMRMMGKGPSRLTQEFCQQCQMLATQHIGGAEVEVALLFADVRGSTTMAERMKPREFSQLIGRFFTTGSHVLLQKHAWIDRLAGDQVVGMFLPYFVGPEHVKIAIDAAQNLLRATGYGTRDGPWIGVGVGVHCGTAFVGAVGSKDGVTDITVLGDVPNVTARLSSAAAAGEILISQDACKRTDLPDDLEERSLTLKGKSQPLTVRVLKPPFAAGTS
jgi:adenylate cyclase